MDYLEYKCDAKIKNQVYVNLVQQCEKSRVQQAVQIVDPATLPFEEKPVWPRPKLMTALGFVFGLIMSFIYTLLVYKKEC